MAIEFLSSFDLVDYEQARSWMEARVQGIRENNAEECVWQLEHPPLYTAGTSACQSELIDKTRFPVYEAGRGGRFTYHGPGQRIAYVMLDLNQRGRDVRRYIHDLEEAVILTLADYDISAERRENRVGIWSERCPRW